MTTTDLTVGVDVGTSSTKVTVADGAGNVVRNVVRRHRTIVTAEGRAEHDAETMWWVEPADALREATAGLRERVRAVSASGIGPCVLIADSAGVPLHPAILYGVDTRAEAQIRELNDALGRDHIVERCGSALSSQAGGPKLLWLHQQRPDIWAHARRVFTCSSFLVHRLCGAYVLDHHTASQYTPMYDIERLEWIEAVWQRWVEGVEPPALAWSTEVVGTVSAGASDATGLPVGAAVTAGTVDAWAEAASVGVRRPGDLMLMYGTTMFLVAVTDQIVRHPALWTTRSVEPEGTCLAGGMATSGSLTSWWSDVSGSPVDDLFADLDASPPGANGLLALPYFAGERTPIFDPAARGVIAGLTLAHTKTDVFRALLESTAFAVRHNLEAFEQAGARVDRIVAVGGGTRGSVWPQIVSDVIGRTQESAVESAGASYGGAWLAAEAVGSAVGDWVVSGGTIHPRPDPVYEQRYHLYRDLYDSTRPIVHRLRRASGDDRPVGASA